MTDDLKSTSPCDCLTRATLHRDDCPYRTHHAGYTPPMPPGSTLQRTCPYCDAELVKPFTFACGTWSRVDVNRTDECQQRELAARKSTPRPIGGPYERAGGPGSTSQHDAERWAKQGGYVGKPAPDNPKPPTARASTSRCIVCGGTGRVVAGAMPDATMKDCPMCAARKSTFEYQPIHPLVTFAEAVRDEAEQRPGGVWKTFLTMANNALAATLPPPTTPGSVLPANAPIEQNAKALADAWDTAYNCDDPQCQCREVVDYDVRMALDHLYEAFHRNPDGKGTSWERVR